jgi:hypothetical protein
VEKITILFSQESEEYFNELILTLYLKDYFLYIENAIKYIEK